MGHHSEWPQKMMANMAMMMNQLNALELARSADKAFMTFLPSIDANDWIEDSKRLRHVFPPRGHAGS